MRGMLSVINHMYRFLLIPLVFFVSAAWAVDAQLPGGAVPQPTVIGPANTVTGNPSSTTVPNGGDLSVKAGQLFLSNLSVAAGGSFRLQQVPYFPTAPTANSYQLLPGATTTVTVASVQWHAGESNISYEWSKAPGSSGGTVTFTPPNNRDATASFSLPGTYYLQVTANAGNGVVNSYQIAAPVVVGKLSQTITLPPIGQQIYGVAPFAVTATASSGLAVELAVQSGPAIWTGNQLTVTGIGTVTMKANQAGNEIYDPAPEVQQSFTVVPAILSATATNVTRAYGVANPSQFDYNITGFVNGDQPSIVMGTPQIETLATLTSGVGSHAITVDTTGMWAPNYTLTGVSGTLTITPATLLITANDKTAVYGDANLPPFTWSASGFKNGENQSVITGSPGLNTTVTPTSDVGTYEITTTVTGTGLSAPNYTFTGVNGSLQVTKAPLTVIADDKSRPYNSANPAFTWTVTGYRNGQDAGVIRGSPELTTSATSSSPVGSYPITVAVGNVDANNYSFTGQVGTLTIGKAAQTITFGSLSQKQIGGPSFGLTGSASSGLEVGYSSSNTLVATVSGNTVVIVGAGSTTITASQAGDDSFEAADDVLQVLTVVDPSNLPPTIAEISDRSADVGDGPISVDVIVADAETPATLLVTSAASSNQSLVPNANLTFSGSYAIRSLLVAPVSNQTGYTTITVTVSDGVNATTESFLFSVSGSSQPPTIIGSKVSPYCHIIEQDLEGALVSVTGNGGISRAVQMVGTAMAFADVALDPGKPTEVTTRIIRSGEQEPPTTMVIGWEASDLGTSGTEGKIIIRRGDSLLFENSLASAAWDLHTGIGAAAVKVDTHAKVAVQYQEAGYFTVTARENGALRGAVEIQVMGIAISPDERVIAQVDHKRPLVVDVNPAGTTADAIFQGLSSGDVEITRDLEVYERVTLGIKPVNRGSLAVVARLPGPNGAILSWKPIEEFELEQRSLDGVIMNGDSFGDVYWGRTAGAFYMNPFIHGVVFTFEFSSSGNPINGTQYVYSSYATPPVISKRYSEENDEEYGVIFFNFPIDGIGSIDWTIESHQTRPGDTPSNPNRIKIGEAFGEEVPFINISVFELTNANDPNETTKYEGSLPTYQDGMSLTSGLFFQGRPHLYPGLSSQGFDVFGDIFIDLEIPSSNQDMLDRLFCRVSYHPFTYSDNYNEVLDESIVRVQPSPLATTLKFHDQRFIQSGLGSSRAYKINPVWDIDGDGEADWDYIKGLGAESAYHSKVASLGFQIRQAQGPITLSGVQVSPQTGGSGKSETTYDEEGNIESQHDDSVYEISALSGSGEVAATVKILGGINEESGNVSVIYHGSYDNDLQNSAIIIIPDGSQAVRNLGVGDHTFGNHSAVGNTLAVKVTGTSILFGEPYYVTGQGNYSSEGIEGPLNPLIFPRHRLDIDPEFGLSRLTELVWNQSIVGLQTQARGTSQSALTVRRSHAFTVNLGGTTSPLFPNVEDLEASVPLGYTDYNDIHFFRYLDLNFKKDDEATLVYKVNGTPQRVVRTFRLSPQVGPPLAVNAVTSVIPNHMWIHHDRDGKHNTHLAIPCVRYQTPNMAPDITVYYNSLDNTDCGLGRGWRTNYDMRIYKVNREAVLIDDRSARMYFRDGKTTTHWGYMERASVLEKRSELVEQEKPVSDFLDGEEFRLIRGDNRTSYFNEDGWLVRHRDLRGSELRVTRDGETGFAQSVTDSYGRTELLTRASIGGGSGTDPLTSLNRGISGAWNFSGEDAYDANGNLSRVKMIGEFDYQIAGMETKEYIITYDDQNRPVNFKEASLPNMATSFSYPSQSQNHLAITAPYGGVTKVYPTSFTYPTGGTTRAGQVVVDPMGVAHVTTESVSFIANKTQTYPYFDLNTVRAVRESTIGLSGDILRERIVNEPENEQIVTYEYGKLKLNDEIVPASHVLLRRTIQAVTGLERGVPTDLTTTWSYLNDTEQHLGLLDSVVQADGSITRYQYSPAGLMTSMIDPRGFTWTFENHVPNGQDQLGVGLPRTIRAPGPTETRPVYERTYHRDGSLASHRDVRWNYTTTYRNDSHGRQTGITYPNAAREVVTTFDPLGRVIHQQDLEGLEAFITYDALGRVTNTKAPGRVDDVTTYIAAGSGYRATTKRGTLILADQQFDAAGRLYKDFAHHELVEFGQAVEECPTTYHYNQMYGWLDQIEDPMGRITTLERDHAGRVTLTRSPLQATMETTWNGLGWPLSVTDPDGHKFRTVYSELGRPRFEINPAGGWVETRYDPMGNVVAVVPSQGAGTTYEYSDDGVLRLATDPFGNRTEQIINAQEKKILTKVNGILATTRTATYNDRGLPESISNSVLGTTQLTYYDDGSIDTVTPQGRGQRKRLRDDEKRTRGTSFPVTLKGGVDQTVSSTVTRDEATGVPVTSRSPNKHKQVVVRSSVTGETNEVQDNAHSGNLEATTTVAKVLIRDANGNIKRFEDALGHDVEQTFDQDGRLKTRYQNGVLTEWFYLPSGRVEYIKKAGVERVRYDYNALGQVIKVTTPGRSPRITSYDNLGLKLYDSDGSLATSYFYDPSTRTLKEAISSDGRIITHRRDDRGRQTSRTDNRGNGVHRRYDDLDRVTHLTHMDGKYESFTYYPTGEVETKTDRAGKVTRYEYDPSGNLLRTIYVTANKTKTHDRTLPATGGVVVETTYGGHVEATTTDVRSRTVQVSRTGMDDVDMTYNAANQLTGKGGDTFGYNQAGQLTSLLRPGVEGITLTYNAQGLVEQEILPNEVTRNYTYDNTGAVSSITQVVGGYSETWNVTRDGQGRISALTHPDHVQSFTYDDRGRLILEERQEQDLSGITQHSYDASDNRTHTVAFSGVEPTTLTFDNGQLPAEVVPVEETAWQVQTQAGRTILAATQTAGILEADLVLHQAPEFLVPVLALQITTGTPVATDGSTAAGVALTGPGGDVYRALWERRRNPPGSFEPTQGRVVLERVDGGTGAVTTLAASTGLGGDGQVVHLTVILTPDALLRASVLVPNQGVLCAEAPSTAIDCRTFTGAMGLVARGVGEAVSATFDDIGWATATGRVATSADYNAFNQLVSESVVDSPSGSGTLARAYAYDALGNQTRVTTTVNGVDQAVDYTYDDLDRMSEVSGNGHTTEFTYFGDSWMRLTENIGDLILKSWTYDDRHIATQSISAGGTATVTSYLTRNGAPLLETTNGVTSVYARDPLGNVVGHLGGYPNGMDTFYHYTRKFSYDAYGVLKREQFGQFDSGSQEIQFTQAGSITAGPRYKGLWFDAGPVGFYKTQTRSYAAGIGRFTQIDPAKAGMNWYAYCGGDPVNRSDPSGLDWRWNGSDWDYEPGTNPFVPYPTFKPTGSEYQEYTYIDAEKYVSLRKRESLFETMRGEGTGVENNYGYGPLFESPYKHWGKIPAADIANAYRTSQPEGAQLITVPSGSDNFLNTAGSPLEEAGVILYGRRLSRPNGTLDIDAATQASFAVGLSNFHNQYMRIEMEAAQAEYDRGVRMGIAKIRGQVEIMLAIQSSVLPGSGFGTLAKGLAGPALRGMGNGVRTLAPRLNPLNYEFDRATVGMSGILPRYSPKYLYRGVPAGTDRYLQAMNGVIRPRGTQLSSTALEKHVLGEDVASGVTSWTTDINQARRFAGSNGAILRIEASKVREIIMPRPNVGRYEHELETLLRGEVRGFEVLP